MMKRANQFITYLVFISSIFVSCQREKIVISELEPEYKIVTHCYIDADSSKLVSCKVFPSMPVFGQTNSENKAIQDATVEIGNKGTWIQLPFNEFSQDYRSNLPEGFFVDGDYYELKISHPGFATAYSKIKLISKYKTEDIQGKISLVKSENDSTQKLKYDISWEDDTRGTNYYRVIPQVGYTNIDFPTDTFYMPPNYSKPILLTEASKKGNKIYWQEQSDYFPFGENGFKAVSIKIYVLNIDKDYYDYHIMIQKMSSEGSFIEPTFFNGNINNSYGIFAACNGLSEKTFPLE